MKDRSGAYRVFYLARFADEVLVFHAFTKKTEKTPKGELAREETIEGVARSAKELAELLGLSSSDCLEIEIRSDLNDKIIEVIKEKALTHAQVAKLAHTSRTRVTALVNRNSGDISTDLMLRILSALGVKAKIHFKVTA